MANGKRPNILVIFGDDIGMWNLSCYSSGMMGYRTPNQAAGKTFKVHLDGFNLLPFLTIDQAMEKLEEAIAGGGH